MERITVAPVGLDTSVLKQDFRSVDRDALRREHGYAPEDVVLCNVSRLSPEKRPLELIDLFLKIRGKKPFKLIIVGNGTLENALKEKIHFNGLEQEVTLYENVPYPEMWKIYCMSDYYVNMNKGEIFGHGHHGSCVLLHLGGGLPGHRTVGDAEGYEGPCSVRR